jgi:hypothetical protein
VRRSSEFVLHKTRCNFKSPYNLGQSNRKLVLWICPMTERVSLRMCCGGSILRSNFGRNHGPRGHHRPIKSIPYHYLPLLLHGISPQLPISLTYRHCLPRKSQPLTLSCTLSHLRSSTTSNPSPSRSTSPPDSPPHKRPPSLPNAEHTSSDVHLTYPISTSFIPVAPHEYP